MTFRINGNENFFNPNSGNKREVKEDAAILEKGTIPVGKPQETQPKPEIDIETLNGLEVFGYQNMGLHLTKSNPTHEIAKFAEFDTRNVSQKDGVQAMNIVNQVDLGSANPALVKMYIANATVSPETQARTATVLSPENDFMARLNSAYGIE